MTVSPPLSQGLDDRVLPPYLRVWMTVSPPYLRVWMTVSPPLSQGLDDRVLPPYLRVWIHHCAVKREDKKRMLDQKQRTFPHLFSNVFLTYLTASLTGIYLQTFEFVCPNLLLPVPINQVIVMEISLLVL